LLDNKSFLWSLLSLHEVWAWSFSTFCIFGTDTSDKTSPNFYCCPLMQELQSCVQGFDLSWPILNCLFQPIMTSSGESGWDHMAAKSAFSTLLLLHRLMSAQSSSFLYCEVDLCCILWMGPSFNNLVILCILHCSRNIKIKLTYF
jgi:hypothetical protein